MANDLWSQLTTAFQTLFSEIVLWIPRIVVLLALVLLAFIVAALAERLLRAFLVRVKFDALLRRVGVDRMLRRVGVRQSIDEFGPRVVYFVLLFVFARTASDSLGLTTISAVLGSLLSYLPNIIAALLILVAGSALAEAAGRGAETASRESGFEHSSVLGQFVTGGLMVILAVMAIAQLRVNTEILRLLLGGLLATGVLAFGLSFGLGSREVTRNVLAGFYAKKLLRIGDHLEVDDRSGRLIAITATQLVLADGNRTHTVANSRLMNSVATQQSVSTRREDPPAGA
jgi:small-conductance mechanosensitive channel